MSQGGHGAERKEGVQGWTLVMMIGQAEGGSSSLPSGAGYMCWNGVFYGDVWHQVGSGPRHDIGYRGRVERPRSTAADQGWSALPRDRRMRCHRIPTFAGLPRSLYRLDQQDGGAGFLAQRDSVALHQLGTGADFFAAVEVFDFVTLLRDEAA